MLRGAITICLAILAMPAGAAPCAPPPSPIVDIASNRFYIDDKHSVIDPALYEKRKAAIKPLEDFRAEIARMASRALKGEREAGLCVGNWLATWAKGGALLGRMHTHQSDYERKWALAAFALSYHHARDFIRSEDRAEILPWFEKVAEVSSRFFDNPGRRRNNHYYWLGLAVGASGHLTGNKAHQAFMRASFEAGLSEITREGDLPQETARGIRALHYNNYALVPLVMMAEIAALHGEDWYARHNGALHRLAAFVLEGQRDPAPISAKAGGAQLPLEARAMSWLPFYERRFPERLSAYPALRKAKLWAAPLGGDLNAAAAAWIR